MRNHVKGLLNKVHTNTKLPGNTAVRKAKEEEKKRRIDELQHLKTVIKDEIAKRGLDLKTFFKKFDKN